jgi:chitosanase
MDQGARIQLYDCNATGTQKWTVSNSAPLDAAPGCQPRLPFWTSINASNEAWLVPARWTPAPSRDLDEPAKKDVAMQLVSAAENSSLDWRGQFGRVEDNAGGRGYSAGIVGFCSGTGDMLELVEAYAMLRPSNVLARHLPALREACGGVSCAGLDPDFPGDWRTAATDPIFRAVQEAEQDRLYFDPAVRDGKADRVRALGQFAYYDAAVVHGYAGLRAIRGRALRRARPPVGGGEESAWLAAFLDARVAEMRRAEAEIGMKRSAADTSRVDTAQRTFLSDGNLDLNAPLIFAVDGAVFRIG